MTPGRMIPAGMAILALAAPPLEAQVGRGQQDVEVELEQFGVGNAYRPGDITAIRLVLTSGLDEPTACWVQWEVPNAEGDVAEYGRTVTLGPGARVPVWLYAPIGPHVSNETIWSVRVFEQRDEQRGRELGGARINPNLSGASRLSLAQGMIGIVGRARMRLEDYLTPWNVRAWPPGAHEETRLVAGLDPQELPDRWEGLRPFEAIVWSNAQPQQLRVDSAAALREYVRRGGHLVIVLPEAGNPWGLGARGQTWLDDLLVTRAPRKDEGVLLSELLPLLSKSREPPVTDYEVSIRVFDEIEPEAPPRQADNRYEPLLALPDGRVVAVQRLVDFGRITLIGLDLASQRLASMRLPEADVLWNRVLGRRADTPQPDQLAAMSDREPRRLTSGSANELTIGDSRIFEQYVDKPGAANTGLLLAVLLFGAYFLLAGPLGFYLLRQRKLVRHSWLAFAITAALFTAVAWGGVRVLRPLGTEYRHVTFLDHVARPPELQSISEPHFQRGRSWGSLYVPSYGDVRVSIESDPMQRDILLTWSAPEKPAERFPNVDRYVIDVARSPADYRIPVRATATQLSADWMGALDPAWGGMISVDPDDPIRVERSPGTADRIAGTLFNDLPAPVTDLLVIWVSDRRMRRREYARDLSELPWVPPNRSGEMLNTGHMWKLGQTWYPGTALSLLEEFTPSGQTTLQTNIYRRYIENEEGDGFSLPGMGTSSARPPADRGRKFMEMLGLFHQLTPPRYIRSGNRDPETVVITRKLGRELDLSAWLNRPCLILIGYLDNTPTPVPLRVNDRPPNSYGLTVVRWIYPLPLEPETIVEREDRDDSQPR